jgi:DNA-binding MarR family transcriptional regulator
MRRHSEAAVGDLSELLKVLRALRRGYDKGNANSLPAYADCALVAVASRPEGASMLELRTEFQLSHPRITRTCKALEREGLVHLSPDPADRRRTLVRLTSRGHGIVDDVLSAFRGRHR